MSEAEALETEAAALAKIAEDLDAATPQQRCVLEAKYGNSAGNRMRSREARAKALERRKKATNLVEKRAKKLGQALAALRTEVMIPITGSDKAVVIA